MPRAGYCSECKKNVWLTADGQCEFGHKPGSISGVYTLADTSGIQSAVNKPKMVKAGYCSECQKNVFLTADGHCQFGHGPGSISNVYETPEAKPAKSKMSQRDKTILTAVSAFVAVIFIIALLSGGSDTNNATQDATPASSTSDTTTTTPAPAPKPTPVKTRQVVGTTATLGAGMFTGGQDVQMGLYDVTPAAGESGNFFVNGVRSYNEILGGDTSWGQVPVVRVQIAAGDKIEISGLSGVTFTPVTAPFVITYAAANLYAGTFTVGEDIGAGRYVAAPGPGESGNFFVQGSSSVNEILGGDTSWGQVPSVTVNLTNGDEIHISGLSQVTFAPSS